MLSSKQALELRNIVSVVAVIKHHYHIKEQGVCCHQYKMIRRIDLWQEGSDKFFLGLDWNSICKGWQRILGAECWYAGGYWLPPLLWRGRTRLVDSTTSRRRRAPQIHAASVPQKPPPDSPGRRCRYYTAACGLSSLGRRLDAVGNPSPPPGTPQERH